MEKTLASQPVYSGRVVKLRVDTVKLSSGRETKREIVEHSDCVAIVAIDAEENVLLVKQFRQLAEKELLEIPAGGIEAGEDPLTTVQRELGEETGYRAKKVVRLGGFYASPGYSTEYLHLYLATELILNQLIAEDTESIELVRMPLSRIPELVASGAICDAKSIAGLLIFLASKKPTNS